MMELNKWRRLLVLVSSTACLTVVGCIWPTDACGCTWPPDQAMLIGRLVNGASLPVVGARVAVATSISENPSNLEAYTGTVATTDSLGEFRGIVYNPGGRPPVWVHLRVVRAGTTDTLRVRGGQITGFRSPSLHPDSTRMTFQLP